MNAATLTLRQARYEQRIWWRTPAAVFFSIALPVLMLLIFGSMNDDGPWEEIDGRRFVEYFVPGMIAFGTMSAAYGNLASRIVFRRESGLLQRLRGTPLPRTALLGGLVVNAVLVTTIVSAFVLAAGKVAFDVGGPDSWPAFVLSMVVGAASFCALGLALAQVIPNAESADPIVFGTLLPLQFFSGMFDPVPAGSFFARLGDVFPVRHLILALLDGFDGRVGWDHLGMLVLWGAAGGAVALRWFRWDRRA